jgi:hypothetical protein
VSGTAGPFRNELVSLLVVTATGQAGARNSGHVGESKRHPIGQLVKAATNQTVVLAGENPGGIGRGGSDSPGRVMLLRLIKIMRPDRRSGWTAARR